MYTAGSMRGSFTKNPGYKMKKIIIGMGTTFVLRRSGNGNKPGNKQARNKNECASAIAGNINTGIHS